MPEATTLTPRPAEATAKPVEVSKSAESGTETPSPGNERRSRSMAEKFKGLFRKSESNTTPPTTQEGLTKLASGELTPPLPPITEAGLTPSANGEPLDTKEGQLLAHEVQQFANDQADTAPATQQSEQQFPPIPTTEPIAHENFDPNNPNAHLAPEQQYTPPTPEPPQYTAAEIAGAQKQALADMDMTHAGIAVPEAVPPTAPTPEGTSPAKTTPESAPNPGSTSEITMPTTSEATTDADTTTENTAGATQPASGEANPPTADAASPAAEATTDAAQTPTAEATSPQPEGTTETATPEQVTPQAESTGPENKPDATTTPETGKAPETKTGETTLTPEQQQMVAMAELGKKLPDNLTDAERKILLETAAKNPDMIESLSKALDNKEATDVIKAAVENPTTQNMQNQETAVVDQIAALEGKEKDGKLSDEEKEKLGFWRGVLKVLKYLGIAALALPAGAVVLGVGTVGAAAVGVGKLAGGQ